MAAFGLLLLVIVVVTVIVYIAGLAWLARYDVREEESPPEEIIGPHPSNQPSRKRQAISAR